MILSRIRLKNWRNFRDVNVVLGDRMFLVGPNASGKSNLLDAIRFLRDIAKLGGGLQAAMRIRGGVSKVRCLAARRDPEIEIEVEISDGQDNQPWRYGIGIIQQVRGRQQRQPILKYEKVWRGEDQLLSRPNAEDEADDLRLTQTHLEQISANVRFRPIASFLESVRYLHLVPQLLRLPESSTGLSPSDDPYGRHFLEVIASTPSKTRDARLKRIEAVLKRAIPQLSNLTQTKDDTGVPHLEAKYEHWRPNAGPQREDQFSDGTLRLIGLFWALMEGDSPLLLEEPELSLHAGIVEKLPALFSQAQRKNKRQILVSTHSADLLNDMGIGAEEVILLEPGAEGTTAQVAVGIDMVKAALSGNLSVGDVVLPRTRPKDLGQLLLF